MICKYRGLICLKVRKPFKFNMSIAGDCHDSEHVNIANIGDIKWQDRFLAIRLDCKTKLQLWTLSCL